MYLEISNSVWYYRQFYLKHRNVVVVTERAPKWWNSIRNMISVQLAQYWNKMESSRRHAAGVCSSKISARIQSTISVINLEFLVRTLSLFYSSTITSYSCTCIHVVLLWLALSNLQTFDFSLVWSAVLGIGVGMRLCLIRSAEILNQKLRRSLCVSCYCTPSCLFLLIYGPK